MVNELKEMGWKKKSKGCAKIYTKEGISQAIVDRKGFGINSAMGFSITSNGKPFDSLEEAAKYAEESLDENQGI